MVATIAAATIAALPSNTPQPTWTASPSPTRARNTPTELPSNTPAPTIQMMASPTSIFELPGPGTPLSGTARIPLVLWTPTPEPFKCDLNKTEPEPYTVFKPGYHFRTEWRVWNRGAVIWKWDGVIFYFVGGDKLFNDPDRAKGAKLAYNVYPQDKILLSVAMTSPKEAGTYSSTWGLRRENRDTPFCTFDMVIRVER
ncbi:MAG: hypothetical protein CVU44_10350 [Chloroflexi bacterium HGW-Chloroflexi-6]|nr:MAG: hypothetical protein CVU44_10350 [Chloroflexi bacterium HGW-Chloroflexi-6]